MARSSRWSKEQRAKLFKMVNSGVAEQEIRQNLSTSDKKGTKRPMSAVEFAQQLKQAMVEAGKIKQISRKKQGKKQAVYAVTATGRLTVSDFKQLTGAKAGEEFVLEKPRGRSNAWRLVPVK
jgi:hypothetical protein